MPNVHRLQPLPVRRNSSLPRMSRTESSPSPLPPYEGKQDKKAALVVGRYGVGSAIATELAKTMDVVITYGHDAGRAKKVTHRILARDDVRQPFNSPSGALNSKHQFSLYRSQTRID